MSQENPRVKIDFDAYDQLDEIFVSDENGVCTFHLEQMSKSQYWMRFYSTKASPLDKELILYASNITAEFDEPSTNEDEPPEFQTPRAEITQEVEHFIKYFGMKALLQEMLSYVDKTKENNDTSQLKENLTKTLKDYEDRYSEEITDPAQ